MKSDKNIVRDILRAQGVWDEPTKEAVAAYRAAADAVRSEATADANYDAQMAENFRDN